MKKKMRLFVQLCAVFSIVLGQAACGTVTVKDRGIRKLSGDPTYQDSKSFFLGGLIGEHRVDGKEICHGRTPLQMQAQDTFVDGLLTVLTIGIYAPRTVKVWCGSAQEGA